MNLPPIYESFRKSGIRFVANSRDGKFKTNCPECKQQNTNFVELDADGQGFRCHCEACGFSGFERLRPARAKPEDNGGTPRDDDDAKRRAVEEAKRELGIEPEQEPEQNLEDAFAEARERDFPDDDGAPGDDAEAQRKAL